jgi:acyl carrier protein
MTRDAIFSTLKDVAVEVLGVDGGTVELSSHLKDDLGADSLDLVEFVMALEDRLDVSIPEEMLVDVRTVSDALDLVLERSGASA